jgi:peptide/nickel transport system permease protein
MDIIRAQSLAAVRAAGAQLDGGIGREVLLAVNRSDFPVIQAVTIYLAVLTMFINLLTDLAYKVADPRVVLK